MNKATDKNLPLYSQPKFLRMLWLFLTLIAAFSMAYAFYTEYVGGLEPCNFCMLQRASMSAFGLLALLAFIHNPKKTGQIIYAVIADLLALSGLILAGRHVWLQHLPEDKVPACGPSFDYLVSQFPITEVIQEIMSGSGDCAEIKWQFFGFSMPEVLLAVFFGLMLVSQGIIILAAKKTHW